MFKRDKSALLRFNKIFLERNREFRMQCGGIYADHAAKGLLKSGATIKKCYKAFEFEQNLALDECFLLISRLTDEPNKTRTRLLQNLRSIVEQNSITRNKQLVARLEKMGVLIGNDGHGATGRLFRAILARLVDQIDKYDEGLTAPKIEQWHIRHPILVRVIPAIIVASIIGLFSLLFGLINLAKLIE